MAAVVAGGIEPKVLGAYEDEVKDLVIPYG
jgi:hypothetical protein